MVELFNNQEPVKVSPVIKALRWTFLIAGIVYGVIKKGALSAREVGIREQQEKERIMRENTIEAERKRESEKEMQMLTDLFLGTNK